LNEHIHVSKRTLRQTPVDIRKVSEFLVLTFAISWGGMTVLYFTDVDIGSSAGQGIGTIIFMGAPAIAAITLLRYRRASIRKGTGLYRGRIRWNVLAWIAPGGLTAAMIGVGLALPDTTFTTEYSAFLLELGFTEAEAVDTIAELEQTGVPVFVLLTGLGLVLGGTLFALAALGEELGWRGLLLTELAPLGFWKLSLLTGVVWGIWHTPLIFLGLQFPDEPVVGIATMTVATVALSPIYTYLTVRAQSVLAATFFHGSFILGVFTSVFLLNGSELVISSFGVVGIVAALFGIVACVVHDRLLADEQITTSGPLSPWSRTEA
jgi:membrane protease YdiL (CAAX protease family)